MSEKQEKIDEIISSEQGCMDTFAYQEFYYDIRYELLAQYSLEELESGEYDE